MSYANVFIGWRLSGKSTKLFTRTTPQNWTSPYATNIPPWLWISDKKRSIEFIKEKLGGNLEPMLFPLDTAKYLQLLHVKTFHDYKQVIKSLIEYSSNSRRLCGYEDFTTRKALFKIQHLVYNRVWEPVFEAMRQYAVLKALIQRYIQFFKVVK